MSDVDETAKLYRAAAHERECLRSILNKLFWMDGKGRAFNTYQDDIDLVTKVPELRIFLTPENYVVPDEDIRAEDA